MDEIEGRPGVSSLGWIVSLVCIVAILCGICLDAAFHDSQGQQEVRQALKDITVQRAEVARIQRELEEIQRGHK